MGYSQRGQHEGFQVLKGLMAHPNFRLPDPEDYPNAIYFTCACIAELISPKQEDGETCEIDCKDLKKAVFDFRFDIVNTWASKSK